MGNHTSSYYGSSETKRRRKRNNKEEEAKGIAEDILFEDETNVFCPQLFAVLPFSNVSFPPNPCLMTRLHRESLSYSILHQFMVPCITIQSHSNTNDPPCGPEVMASILPTMDNSNMLSPWETKARTISTETASNPKDVDHVSNTNHAYKFLPAYGKLHVSQKFYDALQLHLSYESNGFPTISSSFHISPNLKVTSQFNDQGSGWLSCQLLTKVKNIFHVSHNSSIDSEPVNNNEKNNDSHYLHLHLGSWLDLRKDFTLNTSTRSISNSIAERFFVGNLSAVHAYASIHVPGCVLALQGKIPNTYDEFPSVSYYASIDLTHENDSNDIRNESRQDNTTKLSYHPKTPPLTVVLRKSPEYTSLGLSQTIVWDRWILNPFEIRDCPKIRNIMAWTVELESQQYFDYKDYNSIDSNTNVPRNSRDEEGKQRQAVPKAGMVWQLNRYLAIKARLSPQQWQGAILLQRWAHPRMIGSVIVGGNKKTGALELQGIHVGMEIGNSRNN
jgi:hypothetical protein